MQKEEERPEDSSTRPSLPSISSVTQVHHALTSPDPTQSAWPPRPDSGHVSPAHASGSRSSPLTPPALPQTGSLSGPANTVAPLEPDIGGLGNFVVNLPNLGPYRPEIFINCPFELNLSPQHQAEYGAIQEIYPYSASRPRNPTDLYVRVVISLLPHGRNIEDGACYKCMERGRTETVLFPDRGFTLKERPDGVKTGVIRFRITCSSSHHVGSTGYRLSFILQDGNNNILANHSSSTTVIIKQEKTKKKRNMESSTPSFLISPTAASRSTPSSTNPYPMTAQIVSPSVGVNRTRGAFRNEVSTTSSAPAIIKLRPDSGPQSGGSVIAIFARNLLADATQIWVWFGDKPVTAVRDQENGILECLLPPSGHPGLVPVRLSYSAKDHEHGSDEEDGQFFFEYKDENGLQIYELALKNGGYCLTGREDLDAKQISSLLMSLDPPISSPPDPAISQAHSGPTSSSFSAFSARPISQSIILRFLSKFLNHPRCKEAIKIKNAFGHTLAHLACLLGYDELLLLIMKMAGDDRGVLDFTDKNGFRPVYYALIGGSQRCIEVLQGFESSSQLCDVAMKDGTGSPDNDSSSSTPRQLTPTVSKTAEHESSILQVFLSRNEIWRTTTSHPPPPLQPKIFWLGCPDLSIPASTILKAHNGEVMVHHTLANQFSEEDISLTSALASAIEIHGVDLILVVGHTGCQACQTAYHLSRHSLAETNTPAQITQWLTPLTRLFNSIPITENSPIEETMELFICESIKSQVAKIAQSQIVRQAWNAGRNVSIHGTIYYSEDGRLVDLGISRSGS